MYLCVCDKRCACKADAPCDEIAYMSTLFKSMADPTRLVIMTVVSQGAKSVGQIVAETGFSQPLVSSRLRLLKEARLVKSRRLGRNVFYELDDEHVSGLFDCARNHVRHAPAHNTKESS